MSWPQQVLEVFCFIGRQGLNQTDSELQRPQSKPVAVFQFLLAGDPPTIQEGSPAAFQVPNPEPPRPVDEHAMLRSDLSAIDAKLAIGALANQKRKTAHGDRFSLPLALGENDQAQFHGTCRE